MLNILIPMAGHGSRFSRAGFQNPKPLIPVFGKAMIEWVIKNLTPKRPHRFIYVCQATHISQFKLGEFLRDISSEAIILEIDAVTEGAACTALIAREYIDNSNPLMIANCDQFIDQDINEYLDHMDQLNADGMIMTMEAFDPKWSFVRLDENNLVREVAEKKVISNEATVGIYNYKHGNEFVKSANLMIEGNLRVNNEFYVAPTFNEMIKSDKRVFCFNIGAVDEKMHGLGTPEDLELFTGNHANKLLFSGFTSSNG